jgi:azurin
MLQHRTKTYWEQPQTSKTGDPKSVKMRSFFFAAAHPSNFQTVDVLPLIRSCCGAMKLTTLVVAAFAFIATACSRNSAPPLVLEITGDDFMKFNVTNFEVKPGQRVTVRFKNVGELPKEAVAHNWVLLSRQANSAQFIAAGFSHPERDYIAFEQEFYVLAKTKMLGPNESDSVSFAAPHEAGSYDYVCTFPEHYAGGMKGIMIVRP